MFEILEMLVVEKEEMVFEVVKKVEVKVKCKVKFKIGLLMFDKKDWKEK